ncbi:MAG: SDR family oxidoreductase [Clostridia bacterium]|nr:SDR family oxidoreductase [Clostridia bacterium]MBQ4366150.1 SDR family oxidoreductase [Clostridia bacterium]MBQ6092970.1 SDR family oxidoreductase [Clostridia bacterium]MBR3095408.1 SDR family oxidoreductase [Clostridia bacterium]
MKVAVVTGASSGIGLETAKLLSKNGWRVWGFSRRGGEDGETLRHLVCDVTDEAQVRAAFQTVFEREGRLDLLVNNAGFGISGAVEDTAADSAKKQFDVNFFGCFLCCRAAIPYLRQSGGGRIINMSSMAAVLPIPFQSFYSASKSAVNALTLALRNELKPFGITVCALMPGDVKTGFTAAREKNGGSEAYAAVVQKSVAVMEHDEQTGMAPRTLAEAVLRLATRKNPKPLSTCGAQYRLFAVLAKLLPQSAVNAIVGKIYS